MRKILCLIILSIVLPKASFSQNIPKEENELIRELTVSFHKKVDSISIADFERIKFDKNISVFGLGEANHGTREFQVLKWKLSEYLIHDYGLNTIMIEFPYSHGLLLSDYVKGKNTLGLRILTDQKNSEYKNEDFIDFINAVRKLNEQRSEEEKIDFLGGDIFGKPTAIKMLKDYFKSIDSSQLIIFHSYEDVERNTYLSAFQQDDIKFSKLSKETHRLLKKNREKYINKGSLIEYNRALKLSQSLGVRWRGNERAKYFSTNILNVLTENGNNKILVIAHNGHIGKSNKEVGSLLKEKLASQYLAIGTDYDEGSFSIWNLKDPSKRFIDTLYTPKLENGFAQKITTLAGDMHYVPLIDREKVNPTWTKQENYIASIGMGFNRDLSPIEFRRKVILTDHFDAIFILKAINPIKRIE